MDEKEELENYRKGIIFFECLQNAIEYATKEGVSIKDIDFWLMIHICGSYFINTESSEKGKKDVKKLVDYCWEKVEKLEKMGKIIRRRIDDAERQ
jgi:Ethanolamine utilization protein EutJ (predicted chaperonin)